MKGTDGDSPVGPEQDGPGWDVKLKANFVTPYGWI